MANGAYFYFVLSLAGSDSPTEINNGSVGPLQVFTLFLAGLVIYKVIFATIYVCKWKCRYNCKKEYKVKRYNLEKNFRKMRAKQDDEEGEGNSSDDDAIYEIAKRIYLAECKKRGEAPFTGGNGTTEEEENSTMSEKEQLQIAIERRHSERMSVKHKDDDYDGAELDDADEEELEDKIVEMQFEKQRPLNQDEINRLSQRAGFGSMMHNVTMSSQVSVTSEFKSDRQNRNHRVSFDEAD